MLSCQLVGSLDMQKIGRDGALVNRDPNTHKRLVDINMEVWEGFSATIMDSQV